MKTPICSILPYKSPSSQLLRLASGAGFALLTLGALCISGCSSGNSVKPQVGAITFTDANGIPLKTTPTSLTVGQGSYVDVTLTNDPQLLGADWSVVCGSAPPPGTPLPPGQPQDESCGTFTPAHTMSGPIPTYVTNGKGYIAFYVAPAAPPKQGIFTLYASATADHSRVATVTLTVGGNPISVGFAPTPPSTLQVGASAQFRVALNNDATNAGVTWSTVCGSTDCGFFGPVQTASGVATTYVAPAAVPTGGAVQVTATSIADPTKAVSATISITSAVTGMASGMVRSGQEPVSGSEVTLYAVTTRETAAQSAANNRNASAIVTTYTGPDGTFSIPYSYECPAPGTQMYLVATGGNAGGGTNPDLALMSALGACSSLGTSQSVVNEATTVATVYAFNGFMTDAKHVGSSGASPSAMATAFATVNDLVDPTTGLVRANTISGRGEVPRAKINTLANLLNSCARTAGSSQGDGSACDQLFHATNPGESPATQAKNTAQSVLLLVRNATGFSTRPNADITLYQLATSSEPYGPTIPAEPSDWTVAIQFPNGQGSPDLSSDKALAADTTNPTVDEAGNVWVRGDGKAVTEFVGGSSIAGGPKAMVSIAARSGRAQ
ncbi:MAG: hypothetical protein JWM43_945 [Acidobacteriaceae bacterium]|nr:hypothetical protein [Acidobacteriaceae bacterium]